MGRRSHKHKCGCKHSKSEQQIKYDFCKALRISKLCKECFLRCILEWISENKEIEEIECNDNTSEEEEEEEENECSCKYCC